MTAIGATTRTYTAACPERSRRDAESRLVSVSGDVSAAYVYDAFGRRIRKTVSGSSVDYLYDLQGHAIAELNGSTGSWNRGEVFVGGWHLATYAANKTFFSITNWMGTERVRTDQTGAVMQYCDWTDYGEYSSCGNYYTHLNPTEVSPHTYAGYEYDAETQLHHTWFRYYNPRLGRFLTTDPLSGSIGNPQSLNKYAYVTGNPANWVDPLGLNQDSRVCFIVVSWTVDPDGKISDERVSPPFCYGVGERVPRPGESGGVTQGTPKLVNGRYQQTQRYTRRDCEADASRKFLTDIGKDVDKPTLTDVVGEVSVPAAFGFAGGFLTNLLASGGVLSEAWYWSSGGGLISTGFAAGGVIARGAAQSGIDFNRRNSEYEKAVQNCSSIITQ